MTAMTLQQKEWVHQKNVALMGLMNFLSLHQQQTPPEIENIKPHNIDKLLKRYDASVPFVGWADVEHPAAYIRAKIRMREHQDTNICVHVISIADGRITGYLDIGNLDMEGRMRNFTLYTFSIDYVWALSDAPRHRVT